ncbi:hypothetical protein NL676_002912 [Syzygium grande]|nr:hypothetical protein NL676_002912 [Syzygium grande]
MSHLRSDKVPSQFEHSDTTVKNFGFTASPELRTEFRTPFRRWKEMEGVSEDDEIDYSVKPEFYDPDLDDKDELWIKKKRNGRATDAVLSCPACFTTLCLECPRHEKYVTQYRAIFVMNCEDMKEKAHPPSSVHPKSRKRRGPSMTASTTSAPPPPASESASSALHDLSLRPQGHPMLLPFTASIYVLGTLDDSNKVHRLLHREKDGRRQGLLRAQDQFARV